MGWLVAIANVVFRTGVVIAFAVIIVAVTVQVVSRNFLPFSPAWTEELTRFALLYLAAFGIGVAYRTGDLVNIDILVEALPSRLAWGLRLFAAVVTLAMAALLIEPALRFTSIGRIQTSPVLGVRMTWSHAATVVMLAGIAIFAALRVLEMLTGRGDGRPQPFDADPEAPEGEAAPPDRR